MLIMDNWYPQVHVGYLFYMAFGTVVRSFARSGAKFHVATNALLVKCIGLFWILRVLHISGIMAFQAAFGNYPLLGIGRVTLAAADQCFFISRGMMMAVETIQTSPIGVGVGLVVEKDPAGNGLIHPADGLFRCFNREGGIAYDGNQ